jgi:probable H4MPT-linked C1 transfer pathway protein
MPFPPVLGLDIGGANLKAAHTNGSARIQSFELWRNPSDLSRALEDSIKSMPESELLAVTMTGELCDCFETKQQGVKAILEGVEKAAARLPIWVWTTTGSFTSVETAKKRSLETASANWLASATFAGQYMPTGSAFLIDIGSTTTDIVPLLNGRPTPRGRSDPERMQFGELVYTGVRRTPVCALLGNDGAAEFFATTLDVYLLLGEIPDDHHDRNTADGRPATRAAAHSRLARMKCADSEMLSIPEAITLAQEVSNRQVDLLREAIRYQIASISTTPEAIVMCGSGEFLARKVLENIKTISLSEKLGNEISHSACAYAVAVLAQESMAGLK